MNDMKNTINYLQEKIEELRYAPGGIEYQKAATSFKALTK